MVASDVVERVAWPGRRGRYTHSVRAFDAAFGLFRSSRYAFWRGLRRAIPLNYCYIGCYETKNHSFRLPLLDLHGTGAKLWQRFERKPTLRGAAKKSKRDSDTTTLVGEMPALCARAPLTATRPSHAMAVAKQMLRSPASLEAEWVDETEPFSELVGSPLSDGGLTVVFGVGWAPEH